MEHQALLGTVASSSILSSHLDEKALVAAILLVLLVLAPVLAGWLLMLRVWSSVTVVRDHSWP